MNVIPYEDAAFDAYATDAMSRAFAIVCYVKPQASRQIIINRIMQLAKAGERDPALLSAKVIEELV